MAVMSALTEFPKALVDWRKSKGMTQEQAAQKAGVSRTAYANWELGFNAPSNKHMEALLQAGFVSEIVAAYGVRSAPTVEVPFIGIVSADLESEWRDVENASDMVEMNRLWLHEKKAENFLACKVVTDSMVPLVFPDDLLFFMRTNVPKINRIVLYRTVDNRLAVKQLCHDGRRYSLHSINPEYDDIQVEGQVEGVLIGVIHKVGTLSIETYDPTGISPFERFSAL